MAVKSKSPSSPARPCLLLLLLFLDVEGPALLAGVYVVGVEDGIIYLAVSGVAIVDDGTEERISSIRITSGDSDDWLVIVPFTLFTFASA